MNELPSVATDQRLGQCGSDSDGLPCVGDADDEAFAADDYTITGVESKPLGER